MKDKALLSFDQAVRRVLAATPEPVSKKVTVSQCADLVLGRAVRARVDLPSFDNSSVDGYAVRSRDVRPRARLRVVETIWAGDVPAKRLRAGMCARIATGAPLPPGADAVVMQEFTKREGGTVEILDGVTPGENVRSKGGDVRRGRRVLQKGRELHPMDLMIAAQSGHADLPVFPKPRVAILSTGSELVPPGRRLSPGKIYDGNTEGLAALAESAGGRVTVRVRTGDAPNAIRRALRRCLSQADVVLTCAGISVGGKDWLRPVLRSLGARENFWRVAMKPGRPLAYFSIRKKRVFCLPGNPVSAFVTFLLFVRPALDKMRGKETDLFPLSARLARPAARSPRRQFLRGRLSFSNGVLTVASSGGQESHMLSSLVDANCLFEIPEGRGRLSRGKTVRIYPFEF